MAKKYFFLIILLFSILISCEEEENKVENNISRVEDTTKVIDALKSLYFALPSPIELASIVKKYADNFKPEILHKTSFSQNYSTQKAQALNFGIYSADLAFVSIFDQKQYSQDYFNTLIKMSSEMEILEGINDSLISKIQENLQNPEEIKRILAEALFKSDAYLKENNKQNIATYIVIGAWVESFYIMCNMVNSSKNKEEVFFLISDQRLILSNIISVISSENLEISIKKELEDLKFMLEKTVTISKQEIIDPYTDSLRVKTIVEYNFDETNNEEIYKKISEIRKNFVSLQ